MSTFAYETLIPDIAPIVPACPDLLIESSVRGALTELCEKAKIWQEEVTISTVANQYDYTLSSIPNYAALHEVLAVVHNGVDLEPISALLLDQRKPKWRETDYYGTPEYFLVSGTDLRLVPVPATSETDSVIVRAQLKPLATSGLSADRLFTYYRDTIINGAVFRLLRLPNREWTDYAGAQIYGSLFNQGLVDAERKARQADTGVARKVKYGGLHMPLSKKRNRYGREVR